MSLKKLGRYELLRVLGKGAMGIVYEGRDPNLDRRVAIKTVKVENLSEEAAAEYEARFRTEARSAARLQHPNIVSVYDSDRDGDIAFLVMEYIQGDDLKHHLDQGVRYSLEQSLKIMRELLSALDYAHRQGIVHRDIKPANLLLEADGCVKLTDFGVARIQDSGEATRTQGSMVGTLKYMAPEQVQGQKIDARADLFSAGVVLYQLLTDRRPFDADNDFSIIHQIIGHTPPPPSSINGGLPPAIDAVVARALAKNREERFANARDFGAALHSAMRRAEDATVVPPADPTRRPESASQGRAGASVPGSGLTQGSGSQSSVTQELELVYWKEVKDSSEPEVLEGFLQRFPEGIYADLARRRVRRLAGGTTGDQTQLAGVAAAAAAVPAPTVGAVPASEASMGRDQEGARELSPQAAALPTLSTGTGQALQGIQAAGDRPTPASTADAPAASADAGPAPAADLMAGEVGLAGPTASTSTNAAPAIPSAIPSPSSVAPAEKPRRKLAPTLVTAMTALVVVAAGLLLTSRGTSDDRQAAASPASSLATAAVAPAAGVTTVAATSQAALVPGTEPAELKPSTSVAAPGSTERAAKPGTAAGKSAAATATAAAKTAASSASAPRKSASSARAKLRPTPAPAATATTVAQVSPPASAEEPRSSDPAPGASARAASPMETCKDRMFLAREYCLHTECAKPSFQNTPMCVRRREEARQREESRIKN
jgi:serine/threonine protein kinase